MILRKLAPLLSLSALTLGLLFVAPHPAQAAEVMCSNDFGSCTVSNDGQSFISCSCLEGGGDEGTGGDELIGLSEEELNTVCLEHLAWCQPQGDGDGDTGTSTGDPTDGTTDSGTSDSGDGDGDGDGDTTTDGSTSDTADGSTGGSGDSTTVGDGDGDPGDSTAGDSTAGDSGSDGGGSLGESGDGGGETGTGGDGGGAEGQAEGGGCAVTTNASGFGLLMLSMLGLLGLRRREND